jgi:hypothetical protein
MARVKESWVRRADVRRFEWRRFGLGIEDSSRAAGRSLLPYIFQRLPAVINRLRLAAAFFLIPILPAHRTDSFTELATDALHRQRQQNIFP